jgi:hypothetical protein
MRVISFITEPSVIRQILKQLGLWVIAPRDPPKQESLPEFVYETFDGGWPGYEEPCVVMN